MRNPWFHFKQFSLRQDLAAMKICTDACIFGAWTANRLGIGSRILDIGTGTGLLTLMLAQAKSSHPTARFEAIEMDEPSCNQAAANFAHSPWADKIAAHAGDVRSFSFSEPFDFVIVNPPFYEGQLLSPTPASNDARHDTTLTLEMLMAVVNRVLKPDGRFAILLPASREEFFTGMASTNGFVLNERCRLKQTPEHAPFRSIMIFSPKDALPDAHDYRSGQTEITIRDGNGKETGELLAIMADYYIR